MVAHYLQVEVIVIPIVDTILLLIQNGRFFFVALE